MIWPMLRLVTATLTMLGVLLGGTLSLADELTPEGAYTLVARDVWSKDPLPNPEELAAARKALEAQAAREPKSARWTYALARVAVIEADRASGHAEKTKRKQALEGFEQAVELQPGNADYQYWLGSASFEHIDDVGMLSKMSLASGGRKAFEKAIAGGSIDKAKEQANALIALPEKRGEYQGHMILARIAVREENWPEMSLQYTAAESSGGVGADPVAVLRSYAWNLLNRKKDPQAAAAIVARYLKVASADALTALFLDGEVRRQLGQCPEARGSRWGAAVCRDLLGQKDAARRDYEEYTRRFPDDEHAKEAKAAMKRLAGS